MTSCVHFLGLWIKDKFHFDLDVNSRLITVTFLFFAPEKTHSQSPPVRFQNGETQQHRTNATRETKNNPCQSHQQQTYKCNDHRRSISSSSLNWSNSVVIKSPPPPTKWPPSLTWTNSTSTCSTTVPPCVSVCCTRSNRRQWTLTCPHSCHPIWPHATAPAPNW